MKSADKVLVALKGMRGGLEGGSSSRKRRLKDEVSHLFTRKKRAWKHKFVCLPTVGEMKVPTTAIYKDDLLKAGLGEKLVEFSNIDMSPEEFREVIYEAFPKLESGGGYELCKCLPNTRKLHPLSSAAYSSPALLKERVGNARTYIRPLQRNLSMEEIFDLPEGVSCMNLASLFLF